LHNLDSEIFKKYEDTKKTWRKLTGKILHSSVGIEPPVRETTGLGMTIIMS
jgi:hypothetical protein